MNDKWDRLQFYPEGGEALLLFQERAPGEEPIAPPGDSSSDIYSLVFGACRLYSKLTETLCLWLLALLPITCV